MPKSADISPPDSTDKDIIDPDTLEPRRKPIASAKEAFDAAKRMFDDRQTANESLGKIRLEYDGAPPRDVNYLKKRALEWCANFSLKSMGIAVTRSTPAYISLLDGLRFLSASRLPDAVAKSQAQEEQVAKAVAPLPADPNQPTPESAPGFPSPDPMPLPGPQEKSEIFQRGITSLLRGWGGFRPFLYQLIQENVLFGHLAVGWPDDIEWRPEAFTFDRYGVGADSGHDINDVECIAFRKDFAIHELAGFIKDRKAAEDAGWNVDNVVEAINSAQQDDKSRDTYESQTKRYADTIRESTYSRALRTETKVVKAWLVGYREYDGKVSQYIVPREGKTTEDNKTVEAKTDTELFYKENRFERMSDTAQLFSVQNGNGKHYGSIGMGREVYGPHRARNFNVCGMMDGIYLNSLQRLPKDSARSQNQSAYEISPPFLYVPATETALGIEPHPFNIEGFEKVEEMLEKQIQVLSNAYLPSVPNQGGEHATAREIIEDARRVDLLTGDKLARFYGQYCAMSETIQRRVCSRENIKAARKFRDAEKKAFDEGKSLLSKDEYEAYNEIRDKEEASEYESYEIPAHLDREAVMLCADLLRQGLTPLDVYRLSRSPVAEPMGDTPGQMGQKIAQLYQSLTGNPGIDQVRMLRDYVSAAGSPQLAEEWCLKPDQSGTEGIKAAQKQLLELAAMQTLGLKVPVASDDNHPVHRQVLKSLFTQGGQMPTPEQLAQNPVAHNATKLASQHFNDHLQAGKQRGEKGPAFEQDYQFGEHVGALITKADMIASQAAAQAQQAQQPQLPIRATFDAMRISELILELTKTLVKEGDLPVSVQDGMTPSDSCEAVACEIGEGYLLDYSKGKVLAIRS